LTGVGRDLEGRRRPYVASDTEVEMGSGGDGWKRTDAGLSVGPYATWSTLTHGKDRDYAGAW